jgi:uncharacterized damage-inducible protein DinB
METSNLAKLLEKSFHGPAWHGPAVLEALENLSVQGASRKIPDTHSIIELVAHMTTWRKFVTKRLKGDNSYEVSDAENFPIEADWEDVLHNLKESQASLLAAIKTFPEDQLFKVVPTRQYDFYTMLHGIIQHDIYHTGQIILLKKISVAG